MNLHNWFEIEIENPTCVGATQQANHMVQAIIRLNLRSESQKYFNSGSIAHTGEDKTWGTFTE